LEDAVSDFAGLEVSRSAIIGTGKNEDFILGVWVATHKGFFGALRAICARAWVY